MINLLPPKARKAAAREYWAHVCTVWGILLSIIALVTFLLLIPSYVLVTSQLTALETAVQEGVGSEESFKAAEEHIRNANLLSSQLNKRDVLVPSHEIIRALEEAASSEIQLNFFKIVRENTTIKNIHIQGTASSREALAQFKITLERSPLFETAVVPISDLARETNLPFAITVIIAPIRNDSYVN